MSEEPWYKDGLKFTCSGCGDCCTGAPGYVWVNKQETQAIADFLKMDFEEFREMYARKIGIRYSLKEFPNGDCCLLYTSPSPRDRTRSRMPSSA